METVSIGIGDVVTLAKNATSVTGVVIGLTVKDSAAERVLIEEIGGWFWVNEGWSVVGLEVEDEV